MAMEVILTAATNVILTVLPLFQTQTTPERH